METCPTPKHRHLTSTRKKLMQTSEIPMDKTHKIAQSVQIKKVLLAS